MKTYVRKKICCTKIFIAALFKVEIFHPLRERKTNFAVFSLLSYQKEWVLITGHREQSQKFNAE